MLKLKNCLFIVRIFCSSFLHFYKYEINVVVCGLVAEQHVVRSLKLSMHKYNSAGSIPAADSYRFVFVMVSGPWSTQASNEYLCCYGCTDFVPIPIETALSPCCLNGNPLSKPLSNKLTKAHFIFIDYNSSATMSTFLSES